MSALPPFVIADFGSADALARHAKGGDDAEAVRPRALLGAVGWVSHRRYALSFETQHMAADWMGEAIARTPAMMAGRPGLAVMEFAYVSPDETGRLVTSEYDPYDDDRLEPSDDFVAA